jgi:aconitate hydratase
MGVLPLIFKEGTTRKTLGLDGSETFDIGGLEGGIKPRMDVPVTITRKDGKRETIVVTCGIFTLEEVEYFKNGGILQFVLRNLARAA